MTLTAEARVTARTGVEMEAMTAAAVAALTVYDMVKGVERGVDDRGGRAAREVRRAQRRLARADAHSTAARSQRRRYRRPDACRRADDLRVARRESEDESGPLLASCADEAGAEVVAMEVVPDDRALIEDRLRHYVDDGVRFIFTTGGTGLTPDDITPEATRAVIERDAPGIAEAMRARGPAAHADGRCSRAASRASPSRTLIVNFPGSPQGGRPALRRPRARCCGHAAETLGARAVGEPPAIELERR